MIIPADYQHYIVLATIFVLFISLFMEWAKPTVGFLFAVLLLVITNILQPRDILEAVANESIISIVLLILITAGIRSHFNIKGLLDVIFRSATTYKQFLAVMMVKVALLSSFINNTPVVVLMTPYVFEWGKKNNISPSKLLIPLSYATIIGGMLTIIGTSTTLVLNGFLFKNNIQTIDDYHLLVIGLAVTVFGIVFLLVFAERLLPSKEDLMERFEGSKREYLIEKRLSIGSELIGKTVKNGGLRNLNGVYLVEIVREESIISPVNPNEVVQPKDILIFAGNTDTIIDLSVSNIGIELPASIKPSGKASLKVVEAVISANSSLIGKTIKESNFRERYDAAVVAIHRNGERLSGKIGRMKIKSGDVILMYVGKSFTEKADILKDLYIISGEERKVVHKKNDGKKLIGILVVTGVLVIFQPYSLFLSLLVISTIMTGMKFITLQNIKRDVDINMVAILVLSLALGQAMVNSGTGMLIAHELVVLLKPFGNIALLTGLVFITAVLTAVITNVGAVSIAFPLALGLTNDLNVDGAPFYLAIAFAASAAFVSPVGYQTNLIVYGPGGYSFKDFLRIGLPMTVLYLAIVLAGIILLYPDIFYS